MRTPQVQNNGNNHDKSIHLRTIDFFFPCLSRQPFADIRFEEWFGQPSNLLELTMLNDIGTLVMRELSCSLAMMISLSCIRLRPFQRTPTQK